MTSCQNLDSLLPLPRVHLMPRKRNPQDATLRNVRASVKDLHALMLVVRKLRQSTADLRVRVERLESRAIPPLR